MTLDLWNLRRPAKNSQANQHEVSKNDNRHPLNDNQQSEENQEPSIKDKQHRPDISTGSSSTTNKPYLANNERGLIIPSNCPDKYRYWAGGQSLRETLQELGASEEIMNRYTGPIP
jgi:hypothetical protein